MFCSFAQPGVLDATFNTSDLGFGNGDGASSDVNCMAVQSDGKIIIGGSFTSFNGISRNYIARLNRDGTIDTSFNVGTGTNNVVYSMAIQLDGKIVLAGNFTSYNGSSSNRIVRLNGDGSLDTSFNVGTGANNFIYSLAIQPDGKILIGGSFTTYNAVARNRMARLNSDGSLDTDFVVGTAANSTVFSIAVQLDGKIVVAGNFTTFNGTSRSRIARLNAIGSIDTSFNVGTGANNSVYSIAVQSDGKILIGGNFTTYSSSSRNYIARLNSDASLDTAFNVGTGCDNYVNTLNIQLDGKILIGGAFTIYNSISKNRIARLNTDGSLDADFILGTGSSSQVKDIEIQEDGKIIIGGYFTSYSGTSRNYIARLDGDGGLDSDFIKNTAANGDIYTLSVQSDDKILIGGYFTTYNNTAVNKIGRLNSDGSLDTSFNVGTGANSDVYSLAVQSNGKILIGGNFTSYNGTSVSKIARLNSDGSLDTSFNVGTGPDSIVYAIRVQSDGKILIGGAFTNYNDTPINYITRLNEDGTLDSSFNSETSLDSYVYSIELQLDGKIIIGGAFTTYNEISSNHIARLNVDGSLDTSFIVGGGADSDIASILVQPNGKIVIGGYFTNYNDTPINYIARLNSDGSLDTSFNVGIGANNEVYALALQPNGKILIGGLFTSFNGISRNRITRLNTDGSTDTGFAIGTGANSPVSTLAVQSDSKILLGGQFTSYNNAGRNRIARIMGDSDSQIPPTVPTLNTSSTSNSETTTVFEVVGYPNPFENYFVLDVNSPIKAPIVLSLFDLSGRLIETREVPSTEIANQKIGNSYPSGVYNVLITQEGNSKSLKMIKK